MRRGVEIRLEVFDIPDGRVEPRDDRHADLPRAAQQQCQREARPRARADDPPKHPLERIAGVSVPSTSGPASSAPIGVATKPMKRLAAVTLPWLSGAI